MQEIATQAPPVLATIDTIIILGFLVLVTAVGFVMSNMASEGIEDYFLGNNKIPWWILGISTATSNFDMSGTMIIVAMIYDLGYRGFLVEMRGGVGLALAFLMIFLGKWLRRSRVMTSAQFMKVRFGTDKAGKTAHLLSAVSQSVLALGMIVYFCVGGGKFLEFFLPWDQSTCTWIMVIVGLGYTLMSGLYGVVFTDVIQMIILGFTAIYLAVKGFQVEATQYVPESWLGLDLSVPDDMKEVMISQDAAFELFGICVLFYFLKSAVEGMGGIGGYTDQRFFAAKNEREAGLLTLESIVISILRWAMVAGLVALGLHMVHSGDPQYEAAMNAINANSEDVLPVVIGTILPAGLKGIVIAGLIAAAMSTFDSTLNAGASYIVVDIYQPYINKEASPEQLMWVSRLATIGLAVAGTLIAAVIPTINAIWQFLTMALMAGFAMPNFLRWYWPRLNGYGFAWGTGAGMVTAIIINTAYASMPMYQSFPLILSLSFIGCVFGSMTTKPVSDDVLIDFWMRVNPGGLWKKYGAKALERGLVTREQRAYRAVERMNDMVATCLAVPFQIVVLIAAMSFIFQDWAKFWGMFAAAIFTGTGLYFFWFKNLKSVEDCEQEDKMYSNSHSI